MAILNSHYNDAYDGMRYYQEQERRYREERERQQMMAMQNTNTAYNPYMQMQQGVTDLQREQAVRAVKAEPDYLTNQKLLLLGEAT